MIKKPKPTKRVYKKTLEREAMKQVKNKILSGYVGIHYDRQGYLDECAVRYEPSLSPRGTK